MRRYSRPCGTGWVACPVSRAVVALALLGGPSTRGPSCTTCVTYVQSVVMSTMAVSKAREKLSDAVEAA